MSKRKRFGVSQALTRGLSETIHVVENNAGMFRNVILPLSRIELDPENPRKLAINLVDVRNGLDKSDIQYQRKVDELEKLKELASTIESSGVINPIVAYKRDEVYRIVAGERRTLASILAGRNEIEARIFNEKPKGFELKLIQWIENTAREDLTLDERINNIRDIIYEYQNQNGKVTISATLIKNITGLSLSQATYYVAVLNAPEDVKTVIEAGQLRSLDKAAIIANIQSDEVRREAIQACMDGYSLKELRKIISREKIDIKKQIQKNLSTRRGRAMTRINMGSTSSTEVVETIIKSVLNHHQFHRYATHFTNVDWAQLDQTTRAFKKLVEIIEQELVRT